jgi:hypothetical protein
MAKIYGKKTVFFMAKIYGMKKTSFLKTFF